jgi:hypothetical protein
MLRKKNLVELDLAKDTIQKNNLVQEMSAKKMLEKDIFHHLHHQVLFFFFCIFVILSCCNYHHYMCCNWGAGGDGHEEEFGGAGFSQGHDSKEQSGAGDERQKDAGEGYIPPSPPPGTFCFAFCHSFMLQLSSLYVLQLVQGPTKLTALSCF